MSFHIAYLLGETWQNLNFLAVCGKAIEVTLYECDFLFFFFFGLVMEPRAPTCYISALTIESHRPAAF